VVLAAGGLTATGVALSIILGVGVLGFAIAQLALRGPISS